MESPFVPFRDPQHSARAHLQRFLGARSGADVSSALVRDRGWLTQAGNLTGLAAINRELIARAETLAPSQRVVLDLDSTEIPVYGQPELSAYNGHFESTGCHPLLLLIAGVIV